MLLHAFRRTEKTPIHLFGVDFSFEPNSAGHVVCEVTDERAAERLLSISEAYVQYTGEAPAPKPAITLKPAAVAAPTPPGGGDDGDGEDDGTDVDAVLSGSSDLPTEFTVGERTYSQAEVIQLAFARSGMDREAWNLNDADDREGLIEAEVTQLIVAQGARVKALADAAAGEAGAPAGDAPNPLLITNDKGETLDLGAMSATKLREFATANGIELPKGNSVKVGDLRLLVAKALTAA